MTLATVFAGVFFDAAAADEGVEDAAEVAGVEAEFGAQLGGRRVFAMGEFEEDSGFGEGQGAVENAFLEEVDLAGEEAVEVADEFGAVHS